MNSRGLPSAHDAEQLQRVADRERARPVALIGLERDLLAADYFFEGLRQELLHSLPSGRIGAWVAAAHACVDLIATGHTARQP